MRERARTISEALNKSSVILNSNDDLAFRTVISDVVGSVPITVPSQDLSVAPMSFTTTETENFKVDYIYLSFSTPVTETVTVTRTDPTLDEILETSSLISASTLRLAHDQTVLIDVDNGQQLKIECTNTGSTGTVTTILKKAGV